MLLMSSKLDHYLRFVSLKHFRTREDQTSDSNLWFWKRYNWFHSSVWKLLIGRKIRIVGCYFHLK